MKMERREALKLLSVGGIGLLLDNPFSSQEQKIKEAQDLVRKITGYMIEAIQIPNPKEYTHYNSCRACGEYIYKATGKEVPDGEIFKFYKTVPENLQAQSPDKLIPGIKSLSFSKYLVEADRGDLSVGFELKVYYPDIPEAWKKELNWKDPKNYFLVEIFSGQTSRRTLFIDRGVDGIVDECRNPFVLDKQREYLEALKLIDRLYNPIVLQRLVR